MIPIQHVHHLVLAASASPGATHAHHLVLAASGTGGTTFTNANTGSFFTTGIGTVATKLGVIAACIVIVVGLFLTGKQAIHGRIGKAIKDFLGMAVAAAFLFNLPWAIDVVNLIGHAVQAILTSLSGAVGGGGGGTAP